MYKIKKYINNTTKDVVYKTTIKTGLDVYICKKEGYIKKLGMFGTKYGSIDNDFIDIKTNKRVKVPDGIAHFLEHKLFEQEGGNALDLFAKMGVSANAYTSFDHTVYYFETNKKYFESIEKLFEMVMKPYLTVENVEKEKGIIMQELKMYEDDPQSVVYYNTLKAMYKEIPLNIEIVGTKESINNINKEYLDTCYYNFYNPKNMFFIAVGDIDVEKTIRKIEIEHSKYLKQTETKEVKRFMKEEPKEICIERIEKQLDVYMPYICMGYKLNRVGAKENIKNKIITNFLNEIYFSKNSDFYEEMYKKGIIQETIELDYEYSKDFAYIIIIGSSKKNKEYIQEVERHLTFVSTNKVKEKDFEVVKRKLIGRALYLSEKPTYIYRDIIDAHLLGVDTFCSNEIFESLTKEDINEFVKKVFCSNNKVISIVKEKEKK